MDDYDDADAGADDADDDDDDDADIPYYTIVVSIFFSIIPILPQYIPYYNMELCGRQRLCDGACNVKPRG